MESIRGAPLPEGWRDRKGPPASWKARKSNLITFKPELVTARLLQATPAAPIIEDELRGYGFHILLWFCFPFFFKTRMI